MTTQKVEEIWDKLATAKTNYDEAKTFDTQLFWLKQLKGKATELRDEIIDTLGGIS